MKKVSAGIIARSHEHGQEVFLIGKPGGLWNVNSVWSIPKGKVESQESLIEAAIREFEEETGLKVQYPLKELGFVVYPSGKKVYAWLSEFDKPHINFNPAQIDYEYPRHSGKFYRVNEISPEWKTLDKVLELINPAQWQLFTRIEPCCST